MTMISNLAATSATQQTGMDDLRQRFQAVNTAAANFLGLSPQDLRAQLESGKSLADIAQAQGKSVADLKNALTAAVGNDPNATAFVNRIVSAQHTEGTGQA